MSTDSPMSAETTALRVLQWAADDHGGGARPVPSGPLREPRSLGRPGAGTLAALGEAVRDCAARLGAGRPPFGDAGPPGLGALFLAAAIGGWAQHDAALLLAEAIRPPRLTEGAAPPGVWAEALARHAVTAPFLTAPGAGLPSPATPRPPDGDDPEPLTEVLLRTSPLTAVLHRPTIAALARGATTEVAAAAGLLSRPRGARVLRATLAQWSADPAVLTWRTDLLSRFSLSDLRPHQVMVADTYVTARLRHGPDWDERLRAAGRVLSGRGKPTESAIATARYWAPLAALWQRDPDLVRARPYLTGYDAALALVQRHRLTVAGAA